MGKQIPFRSLPLDLADLRYQHGPDSSLRPGVASGETTQIQLDESRVFPGTVRRVWIHVPDRYRPGVAANVAVFNDGWWYLDPTAEVRAGIVLDNLVARGEIPVTIGVR